MSLLATLQPARPQTLLAPLAAEVGLSEADYQARLRPDAPEYDGDLQWRLLQAYVGHLCSLLERVGEAGADLVLLPEGTLPVGGCYRDGGDNLRAACLRAEPYWLECSAAVARRHRMLIASCYYRCQEGRLYNDGVLMDERGAVAGVYHKVHLPCEVDWEATEAGLFTAGDDYPVFATSVGDLGFQICYDIDFPEGCRILALQGVDVILHPTVGYNFPDEEELMGEARLRTRATDNSVVVMYSNFGPSVGRSAIYGRNGSQLACCGRGADVFALAQLDLQAPRQQDWGEIRHDHRLQLACKRRPDTYGLLVDRRPPLLGRAEPHSGRIYRYAEDVGLE